MIGIYGYYHNGKCLYIGSSKDVKKRYLKHKSSCYNKNCKGYNIPFYKYIRENNINFLDLNFVVLQKFQNYDKIILENNEKMLIEFINPICNKSIPLRTDKEYEEYQKEYYKDNKDDILKKNKDYYEDNKDDILKYKKDYYINNKDKILEQMKEKIICEYCFRIYNRSNLRRHQKGNGCSLNFDILFKEF